jgi:hypothetical protein
MDQIDPRKDILGIKHKSIHPGINTKIRRYYHLPKTTSIGFSSLLHLCDTIVGAPQFPYPTSNYVLSVTAEEGELQQHEIKA